ncbi:MAG: arginine deiminase family protein [Acidobacteriota bacterium]|nr:arginine deiminase family protein [Acidobacteriota bacterium]
MSLRVDSEIGRLRRVLVHRPGRAIDWMVPSMMERLLFDDILDSRSAQREHDRFCRVLQKAGVETLDPEDLLADVLVDSAVRDSALEVLRRDYGLREESSRILEQLETRELAAVLIRGVRESQPERRTRTPHFFELAPLPNYFFQRDPQVVFGNRVLIASMATDAREREPFLSRLLFEHHPALSQAEDIWSIGAPASNAPEHIMGYPYPYLEGGDVLVASPEVILVGVSARTNMLGVEVLAEHLRSHETSFRNLLVVQLPAKRSYMHLDTVFTFIDEGQCLGYLPVVETGTAESGRVYEVDLEAPELSFAPRESLRRALEAHGMPVEIVPCGGGEDLLFQQREQWTDGANAFAMAPGLICIYQRNRRTLEELARRGWRVLTDAQALEDGVELVGQGPTVVALRASELSRARGGPRCMTMPLERDPLGA